MSRTLLLLRHAKAERGDAGLEDHARRLTSRGERAATLIGVHLAQRGLRPERILCSTAVRAHETLERVRAELPEAPPVLLEGGLYLAGSGALAERLAALDSEVASVLLVGHNPGLEDLARGLVADGNKTALQRLAHGLPTAALAEIALGIEAWRELEPGCGRLVALTRPRDLV